MRHILLSIALALSCSACVGPVPAENAAVYAPSPYSYYPYSYSYYPYSYYPYAYNPWFGAPSVGIGLGATFGFRGHHPHHHRGFHHGGHHGHGGHHRH